MITFKAITKGMRYMKKRSKDITTPLLAFQGGEDIVTSASEVLRFVDDAYSKDKKLIYVPRMKHAISCETNIEETLEEIVVWLNRRS